jgi:hypothetical protein
MRIASREKESMGQKITREGAEEFRRRWGWK